MSQERRSEMKCPEAEDIRLDGVLDAAIHSYLKATIPVNFRSDEFFLAFVHYIQG